MAKNKLTDLNNHLFEQLERLNDDEIMMDNAEAEIERSKAITNLSRTIIENGRLLLNARKHADEFGYGDHRNEKKLPELLDEKD